MQKSSVTRLMTIVMFCWGLVRTTDAATVTVSGTAPTVDGQDIAQFDGANNTDKWWSDTANHGQTFLTGDAAVTLHAFTLQTSSQAPATKHYSIRVGEVSGDAFTTIAIETGSQSADMAADDFITFTFDTAIELSANTLYGVDVEMTGSTTPWQSGIPYLHYARTDLYSGGVRYTRDDGDPETISLSASWDRIFHLDLNEIPIILSDLGVTEIGTNSATFHATLAAPNTNANVYVFWGPADGANDPVAWTNTAHVGAWANVASTNVSYTATGLDSGMRYYYTFRGTNDVIDRWADGSQTFITVGTPAVTTYGGATDIRPGKATLHGELTGGGSADAYICWGESDGGTTGTDAWEHVESMGVVEQGTPFSIALTELVNAVTYTYRVHVTNTTGKAWSDTAAFTPPVPRPSLPGDIAIYREATGGEDIPQGPGSALACDWDTVVRYNDNSHALQDDNTTISCAEGHHLVMYSAYLDRTASGNRSEAQGQLRLAGVDLPIGWSQCYTRWDNGNEEAVLSGGGIIEAGADDPLVLRIFRTDDNSSGSLQRWPDASGVQLLKLDDNWDYCRLSLANDQTGPIDSSWVAIGYDSQDELDTGAFEHASGNPDITLKVAGHYLVFANTHAFCSVERTILKHRLMLDGTEVDGSRTTVYIRGNQNSCSEGAATIGMIIEAGANQVLTVEGSLDVDRNPCTYKANMTAVSVAKLPDDADYIRLDDSGTDDFNPAVMTALGWDTELELDSTGFTHNDTRVGVVEDDDYLFLSTLYDEDDSGQRLCYWQRWQTDGSSILPYGQAGRYARDTGGADSCGNWSGIMLELTAGQYVEVVSEQLGNAGTLTADMKGLQGVRLGTLFPTGPIRLSALASSDVTSHTATLSANLVGTNGYVTVYWKAGTVPTPYVHTGWDGTNGPGAETTGAVVRLAANLTEDTFYTYAFYAIDNATGSNAWAAAGFATALTLTQTPVFTSATSPEYVMVELEWLDNAATETGYVLQRSETGRGGPYDIIAKLGADTTSYTDRDVLASTTYYYQLAATNSANGSATAFAACQAEATTGEAPPGLLFADTFDRPDSIDLNASRVGKSGILGALNYTTRTFNAVVLDINSNTVRMNGPAADGNYGGLVYINDHNFTDAAILAGGGFSISMDLAEYSTAGSGRYMGIGVGASLSELDTQTGVGPARTPGDLFVGFRQTTDALEIFRNGVQDVGASVTGGVPDAPTTMRIDYLLTDFNAGSTVSYAVFFDQSEIPITAGSFTWSGTRENYISFSSNLSNDNRFDNFEIRANAPIAPPGMTIFLR